MKKRVEKPADVLPFDFWEEEAEAEKERFCRKVEELKTFAAPKNENEQLFNLQKEYYKGNDKALSQMFVVLLKVAPKQVNIEMCSSKGRRRFSQDRIDEMALDAVGLFIEQIKKNRLIITESFISYLRLQVRKVMNGQTKAQKFEKFCIKNHIPIFSMTPEEKAAVKNQFEKELKNM